MADVSIKKDISDVQKMTKKLMAAKKCACCGNKFYMASAELWAYKHYKANGFSYYCSYTCMRKTPFKRKNL